VESESLELEDHEKAWLWLAGLLLFVIVIAALLDQFAYGIPVSIVSVQLDKELTVSMLIYYVTVIAISVYVAALGLKELAWERRFSIEFLMAVAALGALYLGFLFEAGTVLLFYVLAEYFEGYIQDRARKAVEKLSEFMPDKARLVTPQGMEHVDVNTVGLGASILVKPGERIALDGVVAEGASFVDQSLVTGESTPLLKKTGDQVFAGTFNTDGVLKVTVNKRAEDTLVSRIATLVLQSRARKASIEKLVDRFAKFYVPAVLMLALLTAFLMPQISGDPFETWLYRALVLLVISCPSAFIISVPATLFSAVTIAAKKGAIIKGGIYIEKMDKIGAVLFDKTGTLTLGRPVVHCVKGVPGLDNEALTYAAGLEQFSNHPLAKAIVKTAEDRGLKFRELEVTDVQEIPGKGVVGHVNGIRVVVGTTEMLQQHGCDYGKVKEAYENERHSAVCVSLGEAATSSICIIDDVREDAAMAVKTLQESGLHTAMLTGDKREMAQEIATRLGIDEVHAELFPEDKLRIISEKRQTYGPVAMAGDGVNDAPALAASDVGIAMAGSNVDIALESADIILVKDELSQIPRVQRLSRATMKIAKQNIALALGVKLSLGALGLMGLVPLWFTVASGDDGLTLLTLLNTLRLTRVQ
jgi:Cd2+/Zn2+-exporting ATPase